MYDAHPSVMLYMKFDVREIHEILKNLPCGTAFVERTVLKTVPLRYTVNEKLLQETRRTEAYDPIITHEFSMTSCFKME